MNSENKPGKLVCVGTGINSMEQLTIGAKKHIESADVVFGVMPNSRIDQWLAGMNPNYQSLQKHYGHGKARQQTYTEMAQTMLREVHAGKYVCCALYGHPGVIATIGHLAIGLARKEGYRAWMEPGISAEDCLFADLGIDPGYFGCQNYEVSQLLFYKHTIDPYGLLILWHISLAGEHTLKRFDTTRDNLQRTVEYLNQWYPPQHRVIIYEAPFMTGDKVRADKIPLKDLPDAQLNPASTLVVPPVSNRRIDSETMARFGLKESDLAQ